ncbi:MAG: tetratricopeptide repeat protein [Hydrogenophaga sp.]|nr:tetratricopeptide repeat protein [Hydrogenophaga sp.]
MNHLLNRKFMQLQIRALVLFGQRLRALERVGDLLGSNAADSYALATRAHLLAELGDKTGAQQALQQLVAAQPDQPAGWFNLGYLSEEMGHLEQAETAFRRATELDPQLDRAWYGLALSLIRQRRFDEAVTALRKNTELQPMSPYGWYQLARVHVDRQEPDEAAKIIRHLRKFEPKVAAQLERETGLGQAQA